MCVEPFKDNQPDGKGTFTFNNGPRKGDVYTGDFREGARTGKVTSKWAGGNVFIGDFVDGVIQGEGTLKFFDNTKSLEIYRGKFVNGKQTEGTYKYVDGRVYCGQFSDGYRHGKGVLMLPNGQVLSGKFVAGRYVGRA